MADCKNKDTEKAVDQATTPAGSPSPSAAGPRMVDYTKPTNLTDVITKPQYGTVERIRDEQFKKSSFTISNRALSVSKRNIVIDKENFGPQLKSFKEGVMMDPVGLEFPDMFRLQSKKYWTIDDSGNSLVNLANAKSNSRHIIQNYNVLNNSETFTDLTSLQTFYNGFIGAKGGGGLDTTTVKMAGKSLSTQLGTQQVVLLEPVKNVTAFFNFEKKKMVGQPVDFDSNLWRIYINGGEIKTNKETTKVPALVPQGTFFYDHTFELPLPFVKKELEKINILNNPLIINLEPTYNFYVEDYEKLLTRYENLTEPSVPNIYVFDSVEDDIKNKKISNIELGNDVKDTMSTANKRTDKNTFRVPASQQPRSTSDRTILNVKKFVKNYFENYVAWAKEYLESLVRRDSAAKTIQDNFDKVKKSFENIAILLSNFEVLRNMNDKKYMFPMYSEIEFSTDETTVIAEILEHSKFSGGLVKRIVNDIQNQSGFENVNLVEAKEMTTQTKDQNSLDKAYSLERTVRKSWDITKWLGDMGSSEEPKNIVYLGNSEEEEYISSNSPQARFIRNIMKLIFVGKLKTLVRDKMRTFEEMLNGKYAYSETIMYRIEKFVVGDDGIIPAEAKSIQNIYLPNSNDVKVINYVDTQVKYGKRYAYRIWAYQAVIGTKYRYDGLVANEKAAAFVVTQEPSIKIMEILYSEINGAILDDPPVFPQVDIVPFRAISDEMMFLLNANTGDYIMNPIVIEPEDQEKINKFRRAKGFNLNEPIRFRTDDHSGVFQIFRTDKKPKEYKDFSGKLIAAVETDISKITPQKATAATFIDRVEPNKKYWYTFRVIDNHDHLSNPTDVFQVEMIDDGGTVYPIIEVVNFDQGKENKTPIKAGKRYIQIIPALAQTLINEDETMVAAKSSDGKKTSISIAQANSVKDLESVSLGVNKERVWGNRYKIRFTSKKTGKKIDLNVSFDKALVKRGEEEDLIKR